MGSYLWHVNMLFGLLFVVGLSSAATILEYKDEEKNIHHVQTAEPGVQVEGEFSFDAPEGDTFALKYTAGEAGFVAEGAHLPTHVEDVEEVAAARSAFMDAFMAREAEAAMEAEAEPEPFRPSTLLSRK